MSDETVAGPAAPVPPVRGLFSSSDAAEITEFIRSTYAEHRSRFGSVSGGARFTASTRDTPVIGADRVVTTIDYEGHSEEGFRDHVFFAVHAGSVGVRSRVGDVVAGRGDVSGYPLHTPIDFTMRHFDVTTVRLSAARVAETAEQVSGVPAGRFDFLGTAPVSPAMGRFWRSLTGTAAGALHDDVSPVSSPLVAESLAHTVAVAALHVFPSTVTTAAYVAGPGHVGPVALRRATTYIEDHAGETVTLADLAAVAGTSPRALQYAFRRVHDTTPLGYLRRVRLERAHRDLQAGDPTRGETVAAVAARWGFAKPGRFAATYAAAYGRPPSHTLRD